MIDIFKNVEYLWFAIVLIIVETAFIFYRIHVINDKLLTLIEAHNAMAEDFSTSMHFIKRFNEAVDEEKNR